MPQPQAKREMLIATPVPEVVRSYGMLRPPKPPKKIPVSAGNAVDELAAILAQHAVVGHVYLEIAIGPEMAQAMLDRNLDNRPLREKKARTMARAMLAKRFRDNQPHPLCFDIKGVLRDGQHRLRAIILSGCTVSFTVCFGCDPAEADYYDQGIPRSVADIAREHGHQNVTLAGSVVALVLRVELEDSTQLDRNELTERLDELMTEPEFDLALKASHRTRDLVTPATAALAFWHIAKHTTHRDKLDGFWDALAKGALLSERNPILRLRNDLTKDRKSKATRDVSVKKAGAIVLAWNSLMERRHPRSFKWDLTIKLPEVV